MKVDKMELRYKGQNPHGYTANAEASGESGTYDEIRAGIFDKDGNCVADILIGLDDKGEPRILLTTDGGGDGDHNLAVFPLKAKDKAVVLFQ